MPTDIDYTPVFELISRPRLSRFDIFFDSNTTSYDYKRYGIYLWSQHASASLYPLLQHLEVLLRNAIDREARKRFGDHWWERVEIDCTKSNWNNFNNGIASAKRHLEKAWKRAERKKCHTSHESEQSTVLKVPQFSHDDIVAATDFGTWKDTLISAYHASNLQDQPHFLWPNSLSKVFKRYNVFSSSPDKAREEILNVVNELKEYRNRLFHHDCIWVKSKSTSSKNAIDTIRHKINLIEKLMLSISPATTRALQVWGAFSHARRVCSTHELALYTKVKPNFTLNNSSLKEIQACLGASIETNKTVSFLVQGKPFGAYPLRP